MATYEKADDEIVTMVKDLISSHYPPLSEAGVDVRCWAAHALVDKNGDVKGCALKRNGWPVLAQVNVVPYKGRVKGHGDCEITVDGDRWDEQDEGRKRAVLDSQLHRLEVRRDAEGAVKLDNALRPKLKLRRADFLVEGFDEIVRRHGGAAVEAEAFNDLHRHWVQQELFPGE
jgi:hypothetical protein